MPARRTRPPFALAFAVASAFAPAFALTLSACGDKTSSAVSPNVTPDTDASLTEDAPPSSPVDASIPSDATTDATTPTPLDDATTTTPTPTADASSPSCIPGQSIACVGPGGCTTNQVCNPTGTAYGPCACVGEASTLACVPGESIACGGPGGCTSFQVCNAEGSAYGPCNCPDAAATDDASAAWSPAQLPGLALWLDDSYGLVMDPAHAGFVLHWLDRSGNGNEASLPGGYEALNGGGALEWIGSTLDPEAINGHDAVACSGGSPSPGTIQLADTPSLDWGNGDFAIVVVVKMTDTGGGYLWEGNGVAIATNTGYEGSGAFALSAGSQTLTVTPPASGQFRVMIATGQTLSFDIGGVDASGATNTTALSGGAVTLCDLIAAEFAEVIAVNGSLAPADLANLHGYFQSKFGLTE